MIEYFKLPGDVTLLTLQLVPGLLLYFISVTARDFLHRKISIENHVNSIFTGKFIEVFARAPSLETTIKHFKAHFLH